MQNQLIKAVIPETHNYTDNLPVYILHQCLICCLYICAFWVCIQRRNTHTKSSFLAYFSETSCATMLNIAHLYEVQWMLCQNGEQSIWEYNMWTDKGNVHENRQPTQTGKISFPLPRSKVTDEFMNRQISF